MALKPCKECGTEISTKAPECPSCGVPSPSAPDKQVKTAVLVALLSPLLILAFCSKNDRPIPSQPAQSQPANPNTPIALEAIKKLDWVKDATYQDYGPIKWHVGILDDGRNIAWAATSICSMLKEYDLVDNSTHVRMIDIRKFAQGQTFRQASLGHRNCSTGEQGHP